MCQCRGREHRTGVCRTCRDVTPYRVGQSYGIHVYQGDRPVATFHNADEAARFVDVVNRTLA